MLVRLSIRDIVLIESCDIELKTSLCVLSGETGAGKSILLDSLGLVLGTRTNISLIRNGKEQASVTAEFDISGNNAAKQLLLDIGLDSTDSIIIRRNISSDGKTRCLVNDQPVTVSSLKRLADTLVELHGQHDQKTLHDATYQRNLLTDYAGVNDIQKIVAEKYKKWREQKTAIEKLEQEIDQLAREREYLEHMNGELKILNPQIGEEEELSEKRLSMMQSEKLFDLLNEVIGELSGGKSVAGAIRNAERSLTRSQLTATSELFAPVIEGLERAAIEVDEALYALEKIGSESQFDQDKLEEIEERLFALKAAGRKYNLPVDELAMLRNDVEEKLEIIRNQKKKLDSLKSLEKEAKAEFVKQSEILLEKRRESAVLLEKSIEKELVPLKMEATRFRVRIERMEESGWSAQGIDSVYFECATNVAKDANEIIFSSLGKIASGGELSRFMLAMKVTLSGAGSVPTIIFDEIDTGTGGAVADAIGKRLAELGKNSQVLVVTHLPQVAARGNQHLLIKKNEIRGKITTEVTELTGDERKEELARMLSGEIITAEARNAAQKLLEHAA